MTISDRIHLLLTRYEKKIITSAEFDELLIWMEGLTEEESEQLSGLYKPLWEQAKTGQLQSAASNVNWQLMLDKVFSSTAPLKTQKNYYRIGWRVAAAVLVILFSTLALYFMVKPGNNKKLVVQKETEKNLPEEVLPNINQTMLTLPDGRQIPLDSIASGNTISDNQFRMSKLNEDEIAYNTDPAFAAPEFHTISVPRGGRAYRVLLADGSRIWLNAESSLRYPSYFTGNDRMVELTGEGYFEIAPRLKSRDSGLKGGKMPFLVKLHNMQVEVLGTHFNIMSYQDEQRTETTLIEGSVKVITNNKSVVLTPGKQAQLYSNGVFQIANTDTALATAWVNGYFHFDKADIKTIFRQIGRWYDLDVAYKGAPSTDLFSGKMERSLPLSGILKLFASSPIKVQVEGKKLIVTAGNTPN